MKNLKKLLALLLVFTMVFALAACGKTEKEDDNSGETGKKPVEEQEGDDEEITLTYLLLSQGKDKDMIQEKINERLKELNAGYKVNLVIYGWDNYNEKLGLAARGTGDEFDLATTASWLGPYRTLVADGGLLDITELIKTASPELYKTFRQEQLEGALIDGKLYGVPTRQTALMARDHFVWNISQLEEIGMKPEDVESLDTVESLEGPLKAYKEKFPDRYPLDGGSEWAVRRVDNLIKTDDNGDAVIENIFATDYMKKAFETIKSYADKGYIHPDAGSDLAPKQDDPDTWLVKRAEGEPGAEALWSDGWGTPVKAVLTAEDIYIGNANIQGKMTSIYAHSKHPEEALDFIQKIGMDEVIQNLLAWGIEGEHYTMKDGQAIAVDGKEDKWAPWQAQLVSDAKRIPGPNVKSPDDPELKKEIEEFEGGLKPAADLGFTPSKEAEELMGQIQGIKDTYYPDLSRGKMETYEDFLSELDAAGIDDLVEQLKEEYQAWKDNK